MQQRRWMGLAPSPPPLLYYAMSLGPQSGPVGDVIRYCSDVWKKSYGFVTRTSPSEPPAATVPGRGEQGGMQFFSTAVCRCKVDTHSNPINQQWRGDKMHCGEDSFFLSRAALGVADGVGGWNEQGIDPSGVSNALMRFAKQAVQRGERDPKRIIDIAFTETRKEGKVRSIG